MPWLTKKLGEVAEIVVGKTPARSDYLNAGIFKVLKYRDIKRTGVNWTINEKGFVKQDATSGLKEIKIGDVLITSAGHTSAKIGEDAAVVKAVPKEFKKVFFTSELICYRPNQKLLLPEWLLTFLHSKDGQEQIKKIVGDSVHLTGAKSRHLEIPLPPLPEQKRIVEKIEKIFAKIDEAERLRAQSLAASAALFPSALHQIFNSEIKSQKSKLSDVAEITSGGTPSRNNPHFYKGNVVWLKSGELNDNQSIEDSEEHITEDALENSNAKVFPVGTVLLAMYGATAGKLGILKKPAATNQAIAGIQSDKKKLSNRFLFYFLLYFRDELIAQAWGGAQPNISQRIIKEIQIPLPPLSEQKRIVTYLDGLSQKARELADLQKQTAADFDALRQSILAKAFSGNI